MGSLLKSDRKPAHKGFGIADPQRAESTIVSFVPLADALNPNVVAAEEGDPPVTFRDEGVHRPARRVGVVGKDGVLLQPGRGPVDHDDRESIVEKLSEDRRGLRPAGWEAKDAIHLVPHPAQVPRLTLRVVLGVGDHEMDVLAQIPLDGAHQLADEAAVSDSDEETDSVQPAPLTGGDDGAPSPLADEMARPLELMEGAVRGVAVHAPLGREHILRRQPSAFQ